MEREGAQSSLHRRLMSTLARGARVQEESRAIIDATLATDDGLQTTLAEVRRGRKQRVAPGTFAFGQVDDQNRFPTG